MKALELCGEQPKATELDCDGHPLPEGSGGGWGSGEPTLPPPKDIRQVAPGAQPLPPFGQ